MPMNYNPSEKTEGGKAEAGDYFFKVDDAQEKTFNSGNDGCALTLLVAALPTRDVKVFDNLVYVPQALWKTEQFLAALGYDFQRPPETHELIGKTGKAKFGLDEKGYLKVEEYYPASANSAPGASKSYQPSSPAAGDDLPF